MSKLQPIYTPDNTTFAGPLQWGLTVFWRAAPTTVHWLLELTAALETDGIRLLGHHLESPKVSQFALSTCAETAPLLVVQRVKGRLQYLVRERWPKAFCGNYALRSFGHVTRDVVEQYVAGQVDHHPMADARVTQRLRQCQITNPDIDLAQPQRTSAALFWYNLHVVLVHRDRWRDIRQETLDGVRAMILRVSRAKGYLLSCAGILPDHIHLTLGCPLDVAPRDVALGFLNNLAVVHGMRAVYQYGGYVGTFGEYDSRAVQTQPVEPAKRRG